MTGARGWTFPEHVVVVADGELDRGRLMALAGAGAGVVAADGGAARSLAAGVVPTIVIGDGDSLSVVERERLVGLGVEVREVDPAKDESDTELCLLEAIRLGARHVSVLGALGGRRPEHAIANVLLLVDPRFDDIELEILARGSRLLRVGHDDASGTMAIEGTAGDYVSLFAVAGPVTGVRTEGLRFPLVGETLRPGPARGLSNEMLQASARVECERGRLLIVHTDGDIETSQRGGD